MQTERHTESQRSLLWWGANIALRFFVWEIQFLISQSLLSKLFWISSLDVQLQFLVWSGSPFMAANATRCVHRGVFLLWKKGISHKKSFRALEMSLASLEIETLHAYSCCQPESLLDSQSSLSCEERSSCARKRVTLTRWARRRVRALLSSPYVVRTIIWKDCSAGSVR